MPAVPQGPEGLFITLEGGEGAGKTTQLRRLAQWFTGLGHAVRMTREPGGSTGAERIRALLLGADAAPFSPLAEAMLFAAARRDHVDQLIRPALAEGAVVLCDRFYDSTRAYQGAARAVPPAAVDALEQLAAGDCRPDLTLILDLPAAEGLRRAALRRQAAGAHVDGFEGEALAFHERIRAGYHALAAAEPGRCRLVDASGDVDAVAGLVRAEVLGRWPALERH
jgi:dTMP kinase